jgi:nitric oxide reductase activation protein
MPAGGTNYYNQDDFLKKDVKANVNLVRPTRSSLVPTVLNPDDKHAADQLRRMFQRVIGSTRVRLEEEGHVFCTDAYIQQRLSGQPLSPYFHATAGHGFSVNILVDMSGSMGAVWKSVEKLVAVLQRALDFPFVDLQTTGFKQDTRGEVDIVLFPKLARGLHGSTVQVSGQTPLSHAVQVGGRLISQGKNDKHVFLISDGFPVYTLKGSPTTVGTQTLINWTRSAVDDLRKQQIKVWAFMIGSSTPSPEEMTEMFGPRNWRKIPTDALYREGSKFVCEQFLKFVRSR